MANTTLEPPFEAYRGAAPYVFVCYAHHDAPEVFPLIKALHDLGYRIWYDEGIDPGNEWPRQIETALAGCSGFLVFISPAANRSKNVRREIHFADNLEKSMVTVFLEETALSDGLGLTLANIEHIYRCRMPDQKRFLRKLRSALPALSLGEPVSTENPSHDGIEVGSPLGSGKARGAPPAPRAQVAPVQTRSPQVVEPSPGPSPVLRVKTEMIYIPEGEFTMGEGSSSRKVYLDGFWIGKNPVTVAEFRAFAPEGSGKYDWKATRPPWGWVDDHPMVNVTWDEARAYCEWAGGNLPTEAQWEKAARGTDGRSYPWGNEWDAAKCRNSVDETSSGPAPVGSYPSGASPYGALDMAGNVWEWCADWWQDRYSDLPDRNPVGPQRGTSRVLRGGSWLNCFPDIFRSATRYNVDPAARLNCIGFRLSGL